MKPYRQLFLSGIAAILLAVPALPRDSQLFMDCRVGQQCRRYRPRSG